MTEAAANPGPKARRWGGARPPGAASLLLTKRVSHPRDPDDGRVRRRVAAVRTEAAVEEAVRLFERAYDEVVK